MSTLAFDPKKPGHLKPVVDAGNAEYYTTRSAEFLLENQTLPKGAPIRKRNLEAAITLLSLALWHETNEV